MKAAELRKLEQEERMMEEFVQELKRAAKESGYDVKITENGLHFYFSFSIFRTTRVRVDWSHHHISHLIT